MTSKGNRFQEGCEILALRPFDLMIGERKIEGKEKYDAMLKYVETC